MVCQPALTYLSTSVSFPQRHGPRRASPAVLTPHLSPQVLAIPLIARHPAFPNVSLLTLVLIIRPLKLVAAMGIVALALLYWRYSGQLPARLALPPIDPASVLIDRRGAALGSANIAVCLALLAAAPTLHWSMWVITAVCAALHAAYNYTTYVVLRPPGMPPRGGATSTGSNIRAGIDSGNGGGPAIHQSGTDTWDVSRAVTVGRSAGNGLGNGAAVPGSTGAPGAAGWVTSASSAAQTVQLAVFKPPPHELGSDRRPLLAAGAAASDVPVDATSPLPPDVHRPNAQATAGAQEWQPAELEAAPLKATPAEVAAVVAKLQPPPPNFRRTLLSLPWSIVPFVLGMFALVAGMAMLYLMIGMQSEAVPHPGPFCRCYFAFRTGSRFTVFQLPPFQTSRLEGVVRCSCNLFVFCDV